MRMLSQRAIGKLSMTYTASLLSVFQCSARTANTVRNSSLMRMQPTWEAARTHHPPHVRVVLQKRTRPRIVATEEQRGDQCDRHNFSVIQVTLGIIVMMHGSKDVGTSAIHCYNLAVHEDLLE
jgi:hypothetical protein